MTKDEKYMAMADAVALIFSKDRSSQIGAVIVSPRNKVLSIGYNGFVRGADDDHEAHHQRPEKYFHTEHAERNALYNAAQDLSGARIYISGMPPCADCARGIIQSEIRQVILRRWDESVIPTRWADSYAASRAMLDRAGVEILTVGGVSPVSIDGQTLAAIAL